MEARSAEIRGHRIRGEDFRAFRFAPCGLHRCAQPGLQCLMISGNGPIDNEVVVVGGGPAGLMAAVALAGADVPTTLVAGRPRPAADNRTTALLAGSVNALDA